MPVAISGKGPVMALFSNGQVACWGPSAYGECATGWAWPRFDLPVLSRQLNCVTQLGGDLAVDASGRVFFWSDDRSGQRGGGQFAPAGVATVVPGLSGMTQLVQGYGTTMHAILGGGQLVWWGAMWPTPGSEPTFQADPAPLAGLPPVSSVSRAGPYSCAVDLEGGVWCWGYNESFQLGDEGPGRLEPKRVEGIDDVTDVYVEVATTCARRADASLWCWGSNGAGKLGRGDRPLDPSPSASPAPVVGLPPIISAVVGASHVCAVTSSRELYCWGRDSNGGLAWGNGIEASTSPLRVPAVSGVVQVVAGVEFTCVLTAERAVLCAGYLAQLGREIEGPYDTQFKPVQFDKTTVFNGPPEAPP